MVSFLMGAGQLFEMEAGQLFEMGAGLCLRWRLDSWLTHMLDRCLRWRLGRY